jgi:hypothetical protein
VTTLPSLVPVQPPATTLPPSVLVRTPVPLLQAHVSIAIHGVAHQVTVIHNDVSAREDRVPVEHHRVVI